MNKTDKSGNEARLESRWSLLPVTEKGNYINFHKNAFEEDLKHAGKKCL